MLLTEVSLYHIWDCTVWPAVDCVVKVIFIQILRSNHVTLKEISSLLKISCKKCSLNSSLLVVVFAIPA